ncbi:proline-rich protein 2 [Perognathus longimembris pacificus]|uniref:proline-rich protein 2 n=1 Tax=Perognathus longimembris pacificus TaxID=214514 RepID=UPI002018759A|nr:proline-rich protein 2 [Perognathus longimembris pacificus]
MRLCVPVTCDLLAPLTSVPHCPTDRVPVRENPGARDPTPPPQKGGDPGFFLTPPSCTRGGRGRGPAGLPQPAGLPLGGPHAGGAPREGKGSGQAAVTSDGGPSPPRASRPPLGREDVAQPGAGGCRRESGRPARLGAENRGWKPARFLETRPPRTGTRPEAGRGLRARPHGPSPTTRRRRAPGRAEDPRLPGRRPHNQVCNRFPAGTRERGRFAGGRPSRLPPPPPRGAALPRRGSRRPAPRPRPKRRPRAPPAKRARPTPARGPGLRPSHAGRCPRPPPRPPAATGRARRARRRPHPQSARRALARARPQRACAPPPGVRPRLQRACAPPPGVRPRPQRACAPPPGVRPRPQPRARARVRPRLQRACAPPPGVRPRLQRACAPPPGAERAWRHRRNAAGSAGRERRRTPPRGGGRSGGGDPRPEEAGPGAGREAPEARIAPPPARPRPRGPISLFLLSSLALSSPLNGPFA